MRIRPLEPFLRLLLRLIRALDPRDISLDGFDPASVKSVLLVSSTALGDTVLSSAAFAPVRRRFPRARIAALIDARYALLFSALGDIDSVVPYRRGWLATAAALVQLRRLRPDLALILHGNEPQATPIAYASGARWILKLPNAANPFLFLLSNQTPRLGWKDLGHGLAQRLQVASLVGCETAGARMQLPVDAGSDQAVARWLTDAGMTGKTLVGFQCCASSRGRMWPQQRFVELGRSLLAADPRIGIVLTGAPGERTYLDAIANGIGPNAAVAAGLPLTQLPSLLRRVRVLVTGDTGTMHMAFAVGTRTVCLFAVSNPKVSGPAYDLERHVVIYRQCDDPTVRSKSDDPSHIARIDVDEVLQAVKRQLRTLEQAS